MGLVSFSAVTEAQELTFPKRKPGLWEVKTVAAQAAGLPATQLCVGENTDNTVNHLDRQASVRGACKSSSFQAVGNGWLSESVCKEGRTNIVSRSLASGDFEKEYRIDTQVTYSPPLSSGKREDKEAVVAAYLGECRPGQRVGDLWVPGMGYINMIDGSVRAIAEPKSRSNVKRKKN